MGRGIHMVNARVRAREGAMRKRDGDDVRGLRGSLINSFIASANGCSSP